MEVCPKLGVEREYEDHEVVSYHYNSWPPFSDYSYRLRINEDKYGIFVKPEVRAAAVAADDDDADADDDGGGDAGEW